jgi:hypothetical protein
LWHHGVVYANTAMAWVPAYGILDSVNALQTDLARGRTVAQSLSRLALQFWIPVEGMLVLDKRVNEADIRRLIALAKQKNLQVLLCVYNAYNDISGSGFSWDRAKTAFADNRAAFVKQILTKSQNTDSMALNSTSNRSVMG